MTENDWPNGLYRDVALISVTKGEMERRLKTGFLSCRDDLDEFDYVLLGSPVKYALRRYKRSPDEGYVLIGMNDASIKAEDQLVEFLDMYNFSRNDVAWINPVE